MPRDMTEMQMWKETPTAPYSLNTFFSCWVLLGLSSPGPGPGPGSGDEEDWEGFWSRWMEREKICQNRRGVHE